MKTLDDLFKGAIFSKEQDEKMAKILFPYVTVKEIMFPTELFYLHGYFPCFWIDLYTNNCPEVINDIFIYQIFFLGGGNLLLHRPCMIYKQKTLYNALQRDNPTCMNYKSFTKNLFKINKEALAKLAIMQADIGIELKTEEEIIEMANEWKKKYNTFRKGMGDIAADGGRLQ